MAENKINSYTKVFEELTNRIGKKVTPDDLFDVCMHQIIRIDDSKIRTDWDDLIKKIQNHPNEKVYVRSHGKNGSGNTNLEKLLEGVFGRKFEIDRDNNTEPNRIINNAFQNINYVDYQTSHIFEERTNNPLLFGAPWMICKTPKILDPFTGHECKGFPNFNENFLIWAYETNEKYIKEYNSLIKKEYWPKLKSIFNMQNEFNDNFMNRMIAALAPIYLENEKLPSKERKNKYVELFYK